MDRDDKLHFDCFMLGATVMRHLYNISPGDERQRQIFDVVREVAEGRLTLHDSPADVAGAAGLPEHVVQEWWDNMGARIEADRARAESVMRVYVDLMPPPGR